MATHLSTRSTQVRHRNPATHLQEQRQIISTLLTGPRSRILEIVHHASMIDSQVLPHPRHIVDKHLRLPRRLSSQIKPHPPLSRRLQPRLVPLRARAILPAHAAHEAEFGATRARHMVTSVVQIHDSEAPRACLPAFFPREPTYLLNCFVSRASLAYMRGLAAARAGVGTARCAALVGIPSWSIIRRAEECRASRH